MLLNMVLVVMRMPAHNHTCLEKLVAGFVNLRSCFLETINQPCDLVNARGGVESFLRQPDKFLRFGSLLVKQLTVETLRASLSKIEGEEVRD